MRACLFFQLEIDVAFCKSLMTIYRLYTENGNRAGFWVQHRSWANLCAQVQSIAGQKSGRLPGNSPLYDGAKISVECFDVRSGRKTVLAGFEESLTDKNFVAIAQPFWDRPHPMA